MNSVIVGARIVYKKNLGLDLINAFSGLKEFAERGIYKKALNNKIDTLAAKRAEITAKVPAEYLGVDLSDLSRITYYGRGRIGAEEDYTFNKARAILRTLLIIDEVQKGDTFNQETVLDQDKAAAIRIQAEQLINNLMDNSSFSFGQVEREVEPNKGM